MVCPPAASCCRIMAATISACPPMVPLHLPPLAGGTPYSVTVLTQPAGQTCSVSNGSGTIGTANVTSVSVSCAALPATTYTLGGNLSGLSSGSLVLQNNGGSNLSLSVNGPFAFNARFASGVAYSVTILTQPAGQTCSVSNGSGTIGSADITSLTVQCRSTAMSPTITINAPTESSTYTTNTSPISIAGTTSSTTNIARVTWASLNGETGDAETTARGLRGPYPELCFRVG